MHSNAENVALDGRTAAEKFGTAELSADSAARAGDGSRVVPTPYFQLKGLLGRILAILLLAPGSMVILLLVALVRLTSRGPGIYSQVRVGRHGREFNMYKIRTMYVDAESNFGPEWTRKNDPRITPIGRWLRKLHLDEFPQLFNVLRGEMNLIGPRPERPEFTRVLAYEIPNYLDRLLVPPGITGLAQINLPPDMDLNSVRRKLVLDLEYIQNASPFLDMRMFASTLLRLLCFNGDFVMKLMRLQRNVPEFDDVEEEDSAATGERRTPSSIIISHNGKSAVPSAPHGNGSLRESARSGGAVSGPHSHEDHLHAN